MTTSIKTYLILFFILMFIITACNNETTGIGKNNYKDYYTFLDTSSATVTYLSEGKYILKVQLQRDSIGGRLESSASTTVGKYQIINDTLYINFPNTGSKEYKSVKVRYFWIDSTLQAGYQMHFAIDPEKIIDSVLGKKFINYSYIESTYNGAKAVIKKDKIIFLTED